jgi:hypothetical protein
MEEHDIGMRRERIRRFMKRISTHATVKQLVKRMPAAVLASAHV